MTRTSRRMVIAALALAPAGCSGLLGGGGPPTALYTLTALRDFSANGPPLKLEILIDRPTSSDALDTVRIALRRNQLSFDYFADSAWTDPAPRMVQGLLVDSLQRSGRVTAVSRDTLAIRGDYELRIELRHFEAEYTGDAPLPTVRIELGLILVRVENRAVVGTRTVVTSGHPAKNDIPSIVAAFDEALHAAMRDTLTWMLAAAESR
jgi:cholesterol transport system auxiliary component